MHDSNDRSVDPISIEHWCRDASAGDTNALERLLWMHHSRLMGFVRRKIGVDWQGKIEPEDILQEAYIDVFQSIGSFEPQGPDAFYHWTARIVTSRFIDRVRHLRRKKRDLAREVSGYQRKNSSHEDLLDRCLAESGTPSLVARKQEAVASLMSCVAKLPDDYREVVQRLHLNQEPLAVIAADMGRSEDAIRRLAGRAVGRLGECVRRASKYLSSTS